MKKIKLILITVAFFAVLNTANAQQIEQDIASFVDSTEILVNNGRRMMLHYVQTRNFERVAEIHHFLNERTSAYNCAAFTISEELHIAALTNNWSDFFTIAEHFSDMGRINLCSPIHDNLLTITLQTEVENNASQLFENALYAPLTIEEIRLLELYFYVIEHGVDETYRQKLRVFRREHPQSEFNDFVRNYLPRAPLRPVIGISMGATQVFPTGNLSNYFSPTTVFNVAFDFNFNRIYAGIQLDAGSMRLNTALLSSTTGYEHDFRQGDRFYYMSVSVPIGYTVIRKNWFELTPFVSFIGGTELISNIYGDVERNRDREFAVVNSFSIGPGLRTEFQLARFHTSDLFFRGDSRINLRFDVGYHIPVRFNYTPARGNMFYARASIVWWMGYF